MLYSKLKTSKYAIIGVGVMFRLDGNLYFVDQVNFDKIIDNCVCEENDNNITSNSDKDTDANSEYICDKDNENNDKFYDIDMDIGESIDDKYILNDLGFIFKEINKYNVVDLKDFVETKNDTKTSWFFSNAFGGKVIDSYTKSKSKSKTEYKINKYIPLDDFVDYVIENNLCILLNKLDSVDKDNKIYGYGLVIYTEDDHLYLLSLKCFDEIKNYSYNLFDKKEESSEDDNYIEIIDNCTFYINNFSRVGSGGNDNVNGNRANKTISHKYTFRKNITLLFAKMIRI